MTNQYTTIQSNSSFESNIRILKGINYKKKTCAILFLFLGAYLFTKLAFLILQVQCMYLFFNLLKTTKCIFLPLWWRAQLILDITSHADHHYFSFLSLKIIFIMGPIRDPLFSFPALPFFLNAKKEGEAADKNILSSESSHNSKR